MAGIWNGRTDSLVNIEWSSVKIKVLGVVLDPGNVEEDNWRLRFTAVGNVLDCWRQHQMSPWGKAQVINTLVLSLVWYVVSLLHVYRWIGEELNTLVFRFFWNGKRDLVEFKSPLFAFCGNHVCVFGNSSLHQKNQVCVFEHFTPAK